MRALVACEMTQIGGQVRVSKELLKQRQAMPLEAKVRMTETRIRAWYEHFDGDVYVSYSGGKDSTVLRHLVKGMYPGVPAVFCDTGLEYPEVRKMGVKYADAVLKPKMNFKRVIERYGYPFPSKEQAQYIRAYKHSKSEKLRNHRLNSRYSINKQWYPLLEAPFEVSDKCCEVMKKEPFRRYERETGRKGMVGTMACESNQRAGQYMRHGCNDFEAKRPLSMPMAFWLEKDVLDYIKGEGLEYAECYGEIKEGYGFTWTTGLDRTGCMFCMFGVHLEMEPNRFQRMKETHPNQYKYCMEKLGIKDVLDYCGIPH